MVVITSVPKELDPLLSEELDKLAIKPSALIPYDESIQKYDFERRTLLDLPEESKAVAAVRELMSGILRRESTSKGAKK
jgi:CO dehydrogenase maturation factor